MDIAIVGLDCRFPSAPEPAALWRLMMGVGDGIGEVPPGRWADDGLFDPDGGRGRANTRAGGFLTDVDAFDNDFFGISPREAAAMDPQQRLVLQAAWRAFEDAGLDPRDQGGSATGVYLGVMSSEWARLSLADPDAIDVHAGTGNGYCMTANRISYLLNLHGPSLAVDSACSSSLLATHLACAALSSGECDQALVGGVNLALTPTLSIYYTQAGLSAPDGRCKPFSALADGIGRAEGVGMVLLRRLSDVVADDQPVYAVIKGSAVNHGGRGNGLTAPSRWAQRDVISAACQRANVRPADVSYIEAHGTGTVLGDSIEVNALGGLHGGRTEPCAIGSVKGNIAHTEGAAGIAGLIKLALAHHHGVVPPSRYADTGNPRLRLDSKGLRLLAEPLSLRSAGAPAVTGVSSFGLGGTNVHVVLAAAPPPMRSNPVEETGGVLTVSADGAAGLARAASALADDLAEPANPLGAVCRASNRVKASGPYRLAFAVEDRDRGLARLRAFAAGSHGTTETGQRVGDGPVCGWLLHGEGPAAVAWGQAFHDRHARYRSAFDAADRVLTPLLGRSLRDFPPTGGPAAGDARHEAAAMFATQYAVGELLLALGPRPAWIASEGVGDHAAAVLCGVLSLAEAARLLAGGTPDTTTFRQPRIPWNSGGLDRRARTGEPDAATRPDRQAPLTAAVEADATAPTHLVEIGPGCPDAAGPAGLADRWPVTRLRTGNGARIIGRELTEVAAALYRAGAALRWDALDPPRPPRPVRLRPYPFATTRFPLRPAPDEQGPAVAPATASSVPVAGDAAATSPDVGGGPGAGNPLVLDWVPPNLPLVDPPGDGEWLVAEPPVGQPHLDPDMPFLATIIEARPAATTICLPLPISGPGRGGPLGVGEIDRVRHVLQRTLHTVQGFLADPRFSAARLVLLTRHAVRVGDDSEIDLAHAAVWGLVRSVAAEHPGRFALVDLDRGLGDELPTGLPATVAAAFAADEPALALRDGTVRVPRLATPTAGADRHGRPGTFAGDGTVLVTGAGGSLGRIVARHLVTAHGVRDLLLVSRRGVDTPGSGALAARLTATGARVRFASCDVADRAALAELLAAVPAEHPLTGVVHIAGVLDDGAVQNLTAEQFDAVLRPKLDAAVHLHDLTRDRNLAAFVLFSSASGVLGNAGQSAYAAANAFLDALAELRRDQGLPAVSLAWGPWADEYAESDGGPDYGGMAGTVGERLNRRGLLPLPVQDALAHLDAALDSGPAVHIPIRLDLDRLVAHGQVPPVLRGLAGDGDASGAGTVAAAGATLRERLGGLPPGERSRVLLDLVLAQVCAVFGWSDTRAANPTTVFVDLGLDSLAGVELGNRLYGVTGIRLPAGLVFDHPTPAALAAYLGELLVPSAPARTGPEAPSGTGQAIAHVVRPELGRRVDDLDADELVRLALGR
jgi:3-oxoacyl-(acyl-carrier-protein) synthase/NADP-dependent 3-hydroxy acid dehydrogenase YdfG